MNREKVCGMTEITKGARDGEKHTRGEDGVSRERERGEREKREEKKRDSHLKRN